MDSSIPRGMYITMALKHHNAQRTTTTADGHRTPLCEAIEGYTRHKNPTAVQELLKHGVSLPDARKLTADQAALLDRLRPLAQEPPEDLVQLICDFATNAKPKKQQKVFPSTAWASWANAAADLIAYTVGL